MISEVKSLEEKTATPPAASLSVYKRYLRKAIRRKTNKAEIEFLNITAMMDMMMIILIFLLKNVSSSPSLLPPSNDLQIPTSVLLTEAAQEGVPIIISRTKIFVDEDPVVDVVGDGLVEAEAKPPGNEAGGLYITKLGQALTAWRKNNQSIQAVQGKESAIREAIVMADASTPYRLLMEVLFTLGKNEFNKFHLMVLQGKKE